jgi:hypothetical protein
MMTGKRMIDFVHSQGNSAMVNCMVNGSIQGVFNAA